MTAGTGQRPTTATTPDAAPAVPAPRRGDQTPARRPAPATGRPREDSRTATTGGAGSRPGRSPGERQAPPHPSGHGAPSFTASWEAALEDLEVEVSAAEDLLDRLHRQADLPPPALRQPWTPPAGLGPLPLPLAERARALADRQVRAADALGRALVLNRRQARAVDSLVDARSARRGGDDAVYLDVAL